MLLLGEQDFAASEHHSLDANSLIMVTLQATWSRSLDSTTSGQRCRAKSPTAVFERGIRRLIEERRVQGVAEEAGNDDEVAEAIQRDEDAWGLHWRGEDQGELNLLKRDCLLLPDESAACYQLFWLDHFQSLYLDKVTLVEGGHRTSAL
jgi:hypothetical protein